MAASLNSLILLTVTAVALASHCEHASVPELHHAIATTGGATAAMMAVGRRLRRLREGGYGGCG
ncbi:hypothetical protein SESBI_09460 [Sesbania bispinosa]|nr:hypothetical protein SESBI_09460 [Sesbania bispinosa]